VSRSRLVIKAETIWQLAPQSGSASKNLEYLTLNESIGTKKSFVSVGDKKHQDAEQVRCLPHPFVQVLLTRRYID
jgi:hypothetical protein